MATYNGHKNWNHWNVALWINNDEALYSLAKRMIKLYGGRDLAAAVMVKHELPKTTPDGAPYTKTAVRAAMVGM